MSSLADGLIDMHTHGIAADLPDLNGRYPGAWPTVAHRDGKALVRIGDKPYRPVDERCWSAARRIADMDADGVAMQVVSPMPATLLHGADPAGARVLAAAQNDFLAGLRAEAPDRLQGFGAVPLQDLDAAIAELERCVVELGLLGVAIGTRVGDSALSAERFDPFFAAAADLGAIVFIHPVDHETDPRLSALGLGFGAGMPTETGVAAAGLLARGVIERRAPARVLLAHGGGTLPWLLPRLDKGELLADRGATGLASERARRLHVDSLTYDPAQLQIVADRLGAGQVVLGTDYPFIARERPPGAVLRDCPALRSAVGRENALTLLASGPARPSGISERNPTWVTSSASA